MGSGATWLPDSHRGGPPFDACTVLQRLLSPLRLRLVFVSFEKVGAYQSSLHAAPISMKVLVAAGGNAADAAVAMAAALNVTEPCSTGIGGDCFCLFYDAKTKKVSGLNGSGRTPKTLDISVLRAQGVKGAEMDHASPHSVSVPGAAAGWADTVATFGTMKLGDLLQPAIELAEKGFPVHEVRVSSWHEAHQWSDTSLFVPQVAAHSWAAGKGLLTTPENPHGVDMLMPSGETPRAGDVMKMPHLANTFKLLAEHGPQGFYKVWVSRDTCWENCVC